MNSFLNIIAHAIKGNKQPLCAYLLSEEPLGQTERELLAEYIAGPDPGRPSMPKVSVKKQRKAALEYLEKVKYYKGRDKKKIAADIYVPLGVERATFYSWIKDVKETINVISKTEKSLGITQGKLVIEFLENVKSGQP